MYNKLIVILFSFFLFFSKTSFYVYAQEANRFRFIAMGCMHLGVFNPEDYELAVNNIKLYNPDFVLFLGGMIDPMAKEPIESLVQKFDYITDTLGVPVFDTPSNCRLTVLPVSIPINRAAFLEKHFLDRYKKRYYTFEYKNNLFICLDSESDNLLEQKKSSLGVENQLDFLKETIAAVSKYDNVFIFTHRSPWFQSETEWFNVVHPLIKRKVRYVFGASTHYFNFKKIDDVTYISISSGYLSASAYSGNFPKKPYFPHFLIVDVDKNEVSIKIVPVKLKPIPLESLGSLLQDADKTVPSELAAIFKPYIISSPIREAILQPSRIIETLKIKPGMNILDVGAGTGLFTFYFAEALKGTGKVFATDTDPEMIGHIKKKIQETKFKNIFPVCVKPEGIDPFYKQHTFDIIFLSETYQYLRHPEDYFRELRPSLAKERGRLYIIHFKNVSDFSEIEFVDFEKVIKVLISEGEDFPVFKRLSKEIQCFIKNWQGEDIPSEIQIKITQDFNKMLLDRLLFYDLMDYYAARGITVGEGEWSASLPYITLFSDIKLAKWLIVHLDAEGIFDKKKNLTDTDKEQLRKLNRILLTKTFDITKLTTLQGETAFPIYVEKDRIISTLETAGYQFVREYDFLNYHYFLEFKRKI